MHLLIPQQPVKKGPFMTSKDVLSIVSRRMSAASKSKHNLLHVNNKDSDDDCVTKKSVNFLKIMSNRFVQEKKEAKNKMQLEQEELNKTCQNNQQIFPNPNQICKSKIRYFYNLVKDNEKLVESGQNPINLLEIFHSYFRYRKNPVLLRELMLSKDRDPSAINNKGKLELGVTEREAQRFKKKYKLEGFLAKFEDKYSDLTESSQLSEEVQDEKLNPLNMLASGLSKVVKRRNSALILRRRSQMMKADSLKIDAKKSRSRSMQGNNQQTKINTVVSAFLLKGAIKTKAKKTESSSCSSVSKSMVSETNKDDKDNVTSSTPDQKNLIKKTTLQNQKKISPYTLKILGTDQSDSNPKCNNENKNSGQYKIQVMDAAENDSNIDHHNETNLVDNVKKETKYSDKLKNHLHHDRTPKKSIFLEFLNRSRSRIQSAQRSSGNHISNDLEFDNNKSILSNILQKSVRNSKRPKNENNIPLNFSTSTNVKLSNEDQNLIYVSEINNNDHTINSMFRKTNVPEYTNSKYIAIDTNQKHSSENIKTNNSKIINLDYLVKSPKEQKNISYKHASTHDDHFSPKGMGRCSTDTDNFEKVAKKFELKKWQTNTDDNIVDSRILDHATQLNSENLDLQAKSPEKVTSPKFFNKNSYFRSQIYSQPSQPKNKDPIILDFENNHDMILNWHKRDLFGKQSSNQQPNFKARASSQYFNKFSGLKTDVGVHKKKAANFFLSDNGLKKARIDSFFPSKKKLSESDVSKTFRSGEMDYFIKTDSTYTQRINPRLKLQKSLLSGNLVNIFKTKPKHSLDKIVLKSKKATFSCPNIKYNTKQNLNVVLTSFEQQGLINLEDTKKDISNNKVFVHKSSCDPKFIISDNRNSSIKSQIKTSLIEKKKDDYYKFASRNILKISRNLVNSEKFSKIVCKKLYTKKQDIRNL